VDLGPPGLDPTYGYGLVNIPGALESLRNRLLPH